MKKNDKIINCPICVTDVGEYIETKCNHEFCEECINEWLDSNNCPLCNYGIYWKIILFFYNTTI